MGTRLAAVASLVPPGSVVADIGTDHAYLPVYLVTEGGCPRAVAVEKSARNARKAQETVLHYNAGHKVDVRIGDGLLALSEKDGVDTIVIAGIGGITICEILEAAGQRLRRYAHIILQPMGNLPQVRRWLFDSDFSFENEKLALEKGHYYEIIAAVQKKDDGCEINAGSEGIKKESYKEALYLELGPCLLRGDDPLLIPWLTEKIKYYEGILKELSRSGQNKGKAKASYISDRCHLMKDVLENVHNRG